MENKNEILERELRALGQYYRNDWSDFDGRTLRDQIEKLLQWFKFEEVDFTDYSDKLKKQELKM